MLVAVLLAATASAQNPTNDSQGVEVPITGVASTCKAAWFKPLIVNDQEAFKKVFDERVFGCKDDKKIKIDFQKYTFIALTKFADCAAFVGVRVTKNTQEKLYIVTVESKYGGCRGMTPHNRPFLLDKVPADYSIRFDGLR